MNVLFLTMSNITDFDGQGIYNDLLRQFSANSDTVYAVSPAERKYNIETNLKQFDNRYLLKVKIGNILKCNIIEKGISTLTMSCFFKKAIKRYFSDIKFDLIVYSTPPITFAEVIAFVKKRDNAKSYLLLKDIFPQNAVDIGMMTKSGIKGIIYKLFRQKEEKLYKISDYIGCMSKANVDYLLKHNPYINKANVHINPNSIEVIKGELSPEKRLEIRAKYSIPQESKVFVYGGNLGRPQDIPFIIECLEANRDKTDRFFVICGTGTEYSKLKAYVESEKPENVLLINGLPKEEYEEFIKAFDVGLIFLDHRFTIPNFPSRLLSYMQNSMPVLACTDPNTDIGKVITEGEFGWWCESNSAENFTALVDSICQSDNIASLGKNGFLYLQNNFTAKKSYEIIMERTGL